MKIFACFAINIAFALGCEAQTVGNLADVAIIDRDSGVALHVDYYRGEYWVAGRPGARYAIEIRDRLGERILAVTSVDGVNVLSGADAAWDQGGYVFDGGARYQITGWRKSDAEIAPQLPTGPKLGTGHGEREYSYVSHTVFTRPQPQYVPDPPG